MQLPQRWNKIITRCHFLKCSLKAAISNPFIFWLKCAEDLTHLSFCLSRNTFKLCAILFPKSGKGNQWPSRCSWIPSPISPNYYGQWSGTMGSLAISWWPQVPHPFPIQETNPGLPKCTLNKYVHSKASLPYRCVYNTHFGNMCLWHLQIIFLAVHLKQPIVS